MKPYAQVLIKCDNCGKEFSTSRCYLKRERKRRFCCKKCEGEYRSLKNTLEHWSGGRISSSTGYRYIKFNGKEIEEHRLVMMKHLGRELKTDEVVHHINGNKLDNRIENLMLLSNAEHAKLHGEQRKQIKKCARCNREFEVLHGRGLCANCYHYMFIKGGLEKYDLSRKKQVPQ